MANYDRKQIHLIASKDTYYNKSKKVFGSCVIEKKQKDTIIKLKAFGLTMGEPHTANLVFYSEKEGVYNYVTLGYLSILKGEGEFKEVYKDSILEKFDLDKALGVFVEIKGGKNGDGIVLLTGNIDLDFSFKNQLVEYKKHPQKAQDCNTTNVEISKNQEKDRTLETLEKVIIEKEEVKEKEVVENTEDINKVIENKSLWVKEEEINSLKKEEDFEKTHYTKEEYVRKEKPKDEKLEKGKMSDFYKELYDSDEKYSTSYSLDILEKIKDEVENLTTLATKSDEEVARFNQKVAIKENSTKENTIEYIFENYERVTPFQMQNIDVDWRSISIKDLGVLQRKYWKLFYEPVIVNAYDKHKEMLLGEYLEDEKHPRHLLAIKDIFTKSKLKNAVDAGVLQFKPKVASDEVADGCLGYWIIRL